MKRLKILFLGAIMPCICSFPAFAGEISPGATPGSLNYQGRLERDNAPVTGPIHITFRIYNTASGGSAVYASPEMLINAVQGIFSASITPDLSVFANAGTLYLEVQVESDVMSPREPLNSVAYALVAKKLEDGASLSVADLTTTGNVGIGTTPTDYDLTVDSSVWIRSGVLILPDGSRMISAGVGSADSLVSGSDGIITVDTNTLGGDIIFQKPLNIFARITNAGDMGIGPLASALTSSPKGRLDVDGSIYVSSPIYDRSGISSVTLSGLFVRGGGITGSNSEHILLGQTNDVIAFWSGGAERMRIHSNGKVGIGLAAPTDSLHAAADIGSNTGIRGGSVTIGGYSGWPPTLPNEIRSEAGSHLLIQQTNNYNVGVGTNTPREKLHVNGSVRADAGVIAATAAFSGAVGVGGSFTVATGGGNTASLPSTTINGDLLVTGTVGSGPSFPALLASTQTFTAPNTFINQVTVSTNLLVANRVGVGVLDFDFAPARYLQVGDNKAEFVNDNAAAYIVSGTNANSKLFFYRGAAEAARFETQGEDLANPALALVAGNTKSYVDSTYYRIYNSVFVVSTAVAATPAIYVSSSLGNVGVGTAIMDPNHRLTVDGNIRISSGSLIFQDGTSIDSTNGGMSVGGISTNDNAIVRSDANSNGVGNVILQAGSLNALVANPGGNVGIGTSSPISRLNVRGGDLVLGTPVLGSYASNGVEDLIVAGNIVVDQGIIQRSATPVQFSALNISGNVFLSTAAGAATRVGSDVAPSYKLDVTGDINASGVLLTGGTQRISAGGTVTNSTWNGATVGVPYGGTGATTLTSGGILYGGGAGAIGAMNVMNSGELLIGDGAGAPTIATLTQASANQVVITNDAGSITLSLPQNIHTGANPIFNGLTLSSLTGVLKGNAAGAVSVMTGTANRLTKWTDSNTIGDSIISDNGTAIDMNSKKIISLDDPDNAQDAATKNYVDSQTGDGAGAWGRQGTNISDGDFLGTTGAGDDLVIKTGSVLLMQNATRMTITSGGTINIAAFGSGVVKSDGSGNLTSGLVDLGSNVTGTLPLSYGGTGVAAASAAAAFDALSPMTALGDIIYGGASGTRTRLAGTAGFLKSTGAAAPTWSAVSLTADISGILGSVNGGTGNGFTKFSGPSGAEKTFTLPNVSATILTSSAPVSVGYGGTGQSTLTSGAVLVGNGPSAVNLVTGVTNATFDVVTTTTTPAQCLSLTITNGIITTVGPAHDCD